MNRRIVGFAMIAAALVTIVIWEFWGRENISYKPVLVLKDDKEPHTVVQEKDFELRKIESPSDKALTERDMEFLEGKETAQYVSEGTELRKEYFEPSKFATGKESKKGIISLPTEWLLSYPQTLRRGDEIHLYSGTVKLMEGVVVHVKDGSGQEVFSLDSERMNNSSVIGYIEIIGDEDLLVDISWQAGEGNRFTLVTVR
ncbi:MAG: hypothetical protein UC708_07845 [Anaerovoracaceae bacterium]|nr:hypothetical protein [Bacillota bacterium]MEE0517778.1 hypothetical protein [Anaerovoracaceae bacterium]